MREVVADDTEALQELAEKLAYIEQLPLTCNSCSTGFMRVAYVSGVNNVSKQSGQMRFIRRILFRCETCHAGTARIVFVDQDDALRSLRRMVREC